MLVSEEVKKDLMNLEQEKVKKGGFPRGELKPALHEIAEKHNEDFGKIRNVYYNHIKDSLGKVLDETESNNIFPYNQSYYFNKQEIRTVLLEGEDYFVAKDVFSALKINRSQNIVRETIKEKERRYPYLKTQYGPVRTLVIHPFSLERLLLALDESNVKELRDNAYSFLSFLISEGFLEEQSIVSDKIIENIKVSEDNKTEIQETSHSIISNDNTSERKTTDIQVANQHGIFKSEKGVQVIDIDSSIQNFAHTTPEEFKLETKKYKTLQPPYKVGDIVEVKVMRIFHYGVIVETVDDYEYSGLIHISEVKDNYIEDLNEYFNEGDIVTAKIKSINKEGKIAFSTVGMEIVSKPQVDFRDQFSGYKETLGDALDKDTVNKLKEHVSVIQELPTDFSERSNVRQTEAVSPISTKPNTQLPLKGDENVIPKATPINSVINENVISNGKSEEEFTDIVSFLNGIVGVLSPKAKEVLRTTIEEYGVFKFTVNMLEVSKNFENDLGLYFMQKVNEKLGERL